MTLGILMFSNQNILPVRREKTQFGKRIDELMIHNEFSKTDSIQVTIYMLLFMIGCFAYIMWRFFIKQIRDCCLKYCKKLESIENKFGDKKWHDDFLACVDFPTLRKLKKEADQEIKKLE